MNVFCLEKKTTPLVSPSPDPNTLPSRWGLFCKSSENAIKDKDIVTRCMRLTEDRERDPQSGNTETVLRFCLI